MTRQIASKLPETIQTDRLVLRTPTIADAPALHKLANNKSIHKFLSSLPHPYTSEHATDFITNLARTKNEHAYAIINLNGELRGGELIGVMSWHLDRDIGLELGYWLGEPYWGKGYASEAVNGLVEATAKTGNTNIFARAATSNHGSIRVLEKTGFIKICEGTDDCGIHKGVHMGIFRWEPGNG